MNLNMNMPTIDVLAERLDNLERARHCLQRRCGFWRRLAGGVLVCAVLLMVAGAAAQRSKLIEAEGFHLVNKDGKATAKLFNTPEGKPVLSFFHGDANVLNLGVSSEGIADMIFYDRAGKARIMMILAEDNASLGFYDPSRTSGLALSSAADGTSGLGFFFRDREDRVTIGTKPDGSGNVTVVDGAGKVVLQAPAR